MDEQDAPIDDWQEDGSGTLDVPAPVVAAAAIVEPPAVQPKPNSAQPPAVDPKIAAQAEADSGTLEDHEAEQQERDERDEKGRFKHRAVSQRSTPADVPLINEYTKRIKTAEALAGADIAKQSGESNRAFEMRRRAVLLERMTAAKTEPAPVAQSAPVVQAPARLPVPADLYPVKASADDPEPDATRYDDLTKYFKDASLWAGREALRQANVQIAQQRQAHAHEQASRSWQQRRAASLTKYPDFATVALAPVSIPGMPHVTEIPQGGLLDALIWEKPFGDDLLYYVKKNPAELGRILAIEDQWEQNAELVLLTKKITAPPESPKPPAAASRPVTRPPTPIRTTPPVATVTVPDDDGSLEDHEKHYYGNGSRRR